MKFLLTICLLYTVGSVYSGVVPSAAFVRTPSLDTAVVESTRVGGNFAYSTVEGHAYTPVAAPIVQSIGVPVTYTAAALPVAPTVRQSIFSQSIYGPPFLTPGIISSHPIFGGVVSQTPIFGQNPIFGQIPIAGQGPVQSPIQEGQVPVQSPIVQPPQSAPQADVPLQGTVVDEDTVSVESA